MKKSLELRAQLDEKRNALRDLLAADTPDPDKIKEVTAEIRSAETQYTAQLTLEETEAQEAQRAFQNDPQLAALESRGSIGEIVCAVIEIETPLVRLLSISRNLDCQLVLFRLAC